MVDLVGNAPTSCDYRSHALLLSYRSIMWRITWESNPAKTRFKRPAYTPVSTCDPYWLLDHYKPTNC